MSRRGQTSTMFGILEHISSRRAELFRALRSVLSTSPRLHYRMKCCTYQYGVILGSQHSKGAQRHGRVMSGETLGSYSWVSRKTGIYNRPMLTHPSLKSSWSLGTIKPSVALGMIRELRYHGHDPGTSMGNKTQVKGSMGNFPAFILFGSGQLGHLGEESFESAQFISLEERNGQTNGQCFQADTHRIQLLKIGNGEVCHSYSV